MAYTLLHLVQWLAQDQTRHNDCAAGYFLLPFHPFQHCPVPKQIISFSTPHSSITSAARKLQPKLQVFFKHLPQFGHANHRRFAKPSTAAAFLQMCPWMFTSPPPTRQARTAAGHPDRCIRFWNEPSHTSAHIARIRTGELTSRKECIGTSNILSGFRDKPRFSEAYAVTAPECGMATHRALFLLPATVKQKLAEIDMLRIRLLQSPQWSCRC